MDASVWKELVVETLRRKIGGAGLKLTDIDNRLGWRPGSTSQTLNGHLPLRLERLYEILGALEISPSAFFAEQEGAAFEAQNEREMAGDTRLRYGDVLKLLDKRIREAVAEEIKRARSEDPDDPDEEPK